MARPNPLTVLGVPAHVVLFEYTSGSSDRFENIRKLAETNYRTLSVRYHPDKGGNQTLWSTFGDAINELRESGSVEYFSREMIDEEDLDSLILTRQAQALKSQDGDMVSGLAECTAFLNQFEIMHVSGPRTFLLDVWLARIVLNVKSPDETTVHLDRMDRFNGKNHDVVPTALLDKPAFRKGVWREKYRMNIDREVASKRTTEPVRWLTIGEFAFHENVRVAGFVELGETRLAPRGSDSSLIAVDSARAPTLTWEPPQDCWFLQDLVYPENGPEDGMGVIVAKGGKLAFAGTILASAPLPSPTTH